MKIGLDDLRLLEAWKCVTGVQDGGSASCARLRDELSRFGCVGCSRIDVCVAEAEHSRPQVVIGRPLGHRLVVVAQPSELAPVNRVVDRLAHADVAEQHPVGVKVEVVELEGRVDVEPLPSARGGGAAGPVPGGESLGERGGRGGGIQVQMGVVGGAGLDVGERAFGGDPDRKLDPREVVWTAAVVVGVACEHDPLARGVGRDVVGPGGWDHRPRLLIGVLDGTAQNAGCASRERKSGAGASRRMVSVSPLATTPAMWLAFPAMYARAPTTSAR